MAFVTITAYAIFVKILKQRAFTELPLRVKASLVVYLIYCPLVFALCILIIYRNPSWGIIIYTEPDYKSYVAITFTLWLSQHWQFTAYYMQTACLFRKTFQASSEQDYTKLHKRKRQLTILQISVISLFLVLLVFLLVANNDLKDKTWYLIWFIFSYFFVITLPIIGVLSTRHIHKHSRSVERIGIRTNSKVIKLYCAFWIVNTLLDIAIAYLVIQLT